MAIEEHTETERKYDAPLDGDVPDLTTAPGVEEVAPPRTVEQVATYYDTADQRLLGARVTLRRRVGGLDDGWHLKLPAGEDQRLEVQLPPGADDDPVPAELLARVRVHVRDRPLVPVAVITTVRSVHWLCDEHGTRVAELSDDRVRAEPRATLGPVEEWREWELEVLDGSPEVLDRVEPALLAAGARRSASASKLGRALGKSNRPDWRRRARGDARTAGDLLLAYLAEHLGRLQTQDQLLRAGHQEGVHQLRVAARRMRSALSTYSSLLEPGVDRALREELRWLGGVLGDARDAQVLRQRLAALVAAQPAELVIGPVAARIDDELRARFNAGRKEAGRVLDDERYFRLLDRLEELLVDPPFTDVAEAPAEVLAPKLLARDLKRLRKRDRTVREAATPHDRDLALHEVRKSAKRLRYAAESASLVLGERAGRLAKAAEELQELLGDLQDSVVARENLRDIGVRAHLAGENGFTFGRLHALQEAGAARTALDYPAVLARLPRKRLRRWLAG